MRYRKKPVVIEAIKFVYTPKGIQELRVFAGTSVGSVSKERRLNAKASVHILTLEDGNEGKVKHVATEGDYIIKGVLGEFYPCKPDIFLLTYESVDE